MSTMQVLPVESIGDLTDKDHGDLDALGVDDHVQYALLAGRAGGQTLFGGVASGEDLTLRSTSDPTTGSIFLGTRSVYNNEGGSGAPRLGIGELSPNEPIHARQDVNGNVGIRIQNADTGAAAVARMICDINAVGATFLTAYGSGFASIGARQALGGAVVANNSMPGGLSIVARAGDVRFYSGGNLDADEWLRIPTTGGIQIWPFNYTFTAAQPGALNWSGSDTFSVLNGTYPNFLTSNRVVTNTLPYAGAMHYGFFHSPTFQNANGVAANHALSIGLYSQPNYTADGAGITNLAHVGYFDNPTARDVNGGAYVFDFVVNAYLTGDYGPVTGTTNHIHIWTPNLAGAGPVTNQYGWFQPDMRGANAYGIFSQITAGVTKWFLFQAAGGAKLQLTGDLGFYGAAPAAQQTVTGSRAGNAALASLLTALATYGLIVDNTTI